MDIRAMYRAGVSISEIHRRTGRDRKTVRKIVREPEDEAPRVVEQARSVCVAIACTE
jgi:transposase